jgi:hypothetical protein
MTYRSSSTTTASTALSPRTRPKLPGMVYPLTVACGVVFERWITPADAELYLLRAARLN